MATDDTYIRAKKDKPGHCCACNCLDGKYCQRWWVISATEIQFCTWLPLETGVIVKYSASHRDISPGDRWTWQRTELSPLFIYTIQRNAGLPANNWSFFIFSGGCVVRVIHEQALDEQLWEGDDDLPFDALGACAGDPPIGTLSARSYRTQAAALIDWPDLQVWDWT